MDADSLPHAYLPHAKGVPTRARREALQPLPPASPTKAVLVDLLGRLPTLRSQRLAAAVVRRLWPGFGRA